LGAAVEVENRSMPMGAAVEAENLRRTI
jgi:hypothetical protein